MHPTLPTAIKSALFLACIVAYVAAIARYVRQRALFARVRQIPASWGGGAATGIFALFVLATLSAYLAGQALPEALVGARGSSKGFAFTGVLVYVFNAFTVYCLLKVASQEGDALRALGLGIAKPVKSILSGLWIYFLFLPMQVVYTLALRAVWKAVCNKPFPDQAAVEFLKNAGPVRFLVLGLLATLFAPVFEELIFRGFIQNGLERSLSPRWSVVVTALLFALAHGRMAPNVVLVSITLCLVYYRTRDLLLCMTLHFAVNFTTVATVLAMRISGP